MNVVSANVLQQHRFNTTALYRAYVLSLLILVGVCSWADRQLLAIVLESLKRELHFSDTQLGLLGGTAFGLFYAAVGLPIAWLADRSNRRNIIAVAIGLWSVFTALSGLAPGYASLFAFRMGVGIGEAGGSAPSQSLVSDYFAARQRAFAMALLYTWFPLGYLISYAWGGWLNETVGWRAAFFIFAAPGVVLAVLIRATVREPPRGWRDPELRAQSRTSLTATLRHLLSRPTVRQLPLAGAAHALGMFGTAVWLPAFFMRTYHLGSSYVGTRLALITGVGGLIGTLAGGSIADRLVARTRDQRWSLWLCGMVLVASAPFTLSVFAVRESGPAFLLLIVPTVLNYMILGPVVASMQNLAAPAHRATAAALYLFLVNLVSMGCGPILVGALSDFFQGRFGTAALRYSLLCLVPLTAVWAAVHFFLAGKALGRDAAREPV
jgi:predicted MFS family arabinose efflux permease